MQGAALVAAREVLDRLQRMDVNGVFNVRVDTAFLTDYLSVVKRPMDLGTVRSKLDAYATADAFAADVRLVYENSIAYCASPGVFFFCGRGGKRHPGRRQEPAQGHRGARA